MGLKIDEFQTEEMTVNRNTDLTLIISGREVEEVKSFTYFGSVDAIDGGTLEGVHSHIKKANGALVQFYPIWKNKNILIRTNILLFNTDVKSVLLHMCEKWKRNRLMRKSLQVFINQCL
jgi:hypothetical protein